MMLDWLYETAAAERIRRAVEDALAQGHKTPDLGGKLSTGEMGQRVVGNLEG
jgi:isocitrate/isopropylmalate dehydrogenase